MNSEVKQRQSWDGPEKYTLCRLGNFPCLQRVSECNCCLLIFFKFQNIGSSNNSRYVKMLFSYALACILNFT